jgi:hypothetical protein
VKALLKRRAIRHGRTLAEEIRTILRDAVKGGRQPAKSDRPTEGLGTRIANRFFGIGFEEGELPRVGGEWGRPAKFDE